MRYRQSNPRYQGGDQRAKELVNNNDVLSTQEQEEVIAYFARSLRSSSQFLKVVVCLHALVALVYLVLLLSGSLMFDLEVDHATTAKLLEVALQQRRVRTAAAEINTAAVTPSPISPAELQATQDPLAVLAALDAQQRDANRRFTQDYLARRSGSLSGTSMTVANVMSVVVMLYSAGLLLWAAWSGYMACRLLRVNVEDLTSTAPRDLGASLAAKRDNNVIGNSIDPAHATPPTGTAQNPLAVRSTRAKLLRLRQRVHTDPPVAQYVIAALAAAASLFWLGALLRRQLAMRGAYAEAGLPPPSVFAGHGVTGALLEYVLALWQPVFHLAIGRLLRSMLDTKENLTALSKMKYRFEKV
ncbi:hypothetical protein ABB37_07766 [Leptomonas pyrrhocoris]|uniref:Transmembrane protein n=1 Tax=Leptomonas pyrrhocoris TaxID=157538 RepID=A0A0M9FUS4_LEPPY|nr:hypothetical protein ABB37_07766 [Leptomonas pyrrhocoris]KPA76443.1 hypothetical protein ABB37_07766 [Leptomonas pyrrhocoris]|eukprot:XP_015654882.1 hypothetical protein ABB37_07766 [Leptomonas pyrrhocoris]